MSNQKNNQESKGVKYYSSAHSEGGFLTSLTLVESEHGSDYYAMKFKAFRGNSEKPSNALHSVRVNGVQAKEVIAQIADKVNAQLASNKKLWDEKRGKEALSIVVGLNVSDTIAKSYMNKHTGKQVNYIDGRCTSIAYVRIGDEVVFQKEAKQADSTPVEQEATPTPVDAEAPTDDLEKEVTLDPKASDFEQRKAELKEKGYTWNSDKQAWVLK